MNRYVPLLLLVCLLPTFLVEIISIRVVKAENEDPLRFGVNFFSTNNHYEPETETIPYLSDLELARDFSMFQDQGLEYVTLCAVWKYHEPELGVYNEAAIDDLIRVCDFASQYNLKVIMNFYTMMSDNSWTMPEWLSPKKFETVFFNQTARQAWLDFLNYTARRLNDCESIWSWNMLNEPARKEWGCNVTIGEFTQLWSEMTNIFKTYSNRSVSVRFTPQTIVDPEHFNNTPELYTMFDYLALNYYEWYCTNETLRSVVLNAQEVGCRVIITEFGSNATVDGQQDIEQIADDYRRIIGLFRSLDLTDCIAWMWRADYDKGLVDNPGEKYNLALDMNGTASPAFLLMGNIKLTLSINGSGSIDPIVGNYFYTCGDEVVFTASPLDGWMFDHWEINSNEIVSDNPLTIPMDDNKSLTAIFVEEIPEFPSWSIIPLFIIGTMALIIYKRQLTKNRKKHVNIPLFSCLVQ